MPSPPCVLATSGVWVSAYVAVSVRFVHSHFYFHPFCSHRLSGYDFRDIIVTGGHTRTFVGARVMAKAVCALVVDVELKSALKCGCLES